MTGYGSLLMGLIVGVAYGLVQVRSPVPPLIALVGLLGIVLGEHAIDMVQHHPAAPRGLVPPGLRRCPRISLARLRALAPHERVSAQSCFCRSEAASSW
jgi:XapX domain-containing protein